MNRETFKELTGEDPEDMFGGDWSNELDELGLEDEDLEELPDDDEDLGKDEE